MWEMFDDIMDCDECGSPGAPPKFMIPPPPRPPSMQDYTKNCNEEEFNLLNSNNWDSDMCAAMPILDASLYSSQSLQTSAIIAVFSLLLVLVVLISSLFVWKNKRKVQNFLPCKTPTRGPHINGGMPGGHSVTYEDPDAHLGHRPLVMRHHHNVEMLHPKSIHFPSGYPMTRSPPFLVSSSPGPDPYRSNDNVYEELGPGRDSDGESEPHLHSDDDFAEDELSLPGERSFNKSVSDTASTIPVSTIYHERVPTKGHERNSLLSSSSSTQNDASVSMSTASSSISGSKTTNNRRNGPGGILSGVLRHTTGRGGRKSRNGSNTDEYQAPMEREPQPAPLQHYHHNNNFHNSLSLSNNNRPGPQYYNTLENEVDRRNRINNQLHHPASGVSTIFRERINYTGSGRCPQPYYMTSNPASNLLNSMRARTNPRSIDRRRIVPPMDPIEPSYGYAEPIYHGASPLAYPSSYILPDYTSSAYRTHNHHQHQHHHQMPPPPSASDAQHIIHHSLDMLQPQQHAIYSRDSSFGSDSGYSHHTRGGSTTATPTPTYEVSQPQPSAQSQKGLSFPWPRRHTAKDNNCTQPSSDNFLPAAATVTSVTDATNGNSSNNNQLNNNIAA